MTPQKAYGALMDLLQPLERNLMLLHLDSSLISRGYTITLVVDFSEVHSHAHPTSEFLGIPYPDQPVSRTVLLRKQVARAALFFGSTYYEDKVILPPHVIELNQHLLALRADLANFSASAESVRGWEAELDHIAQADIVRESLSKFESSGYIEPDLVARLSEYLEYRIRDVLYLLAGVAEDGMRTIRELLRDEDRTGPRLRMASSKWPQMLPAIHQVLQAPSSIWYDRFSRMRPGNRFEENNRRDAKVIDLVLALNRKLIPEQRLVLLVSDAPSMVRVLTRPDDADLGESEGELVWSEYGACLQIPGVPGPIPILRSLDTFYYSLLFQGSTLAETRTALVRELHRIDVFHLLGTSVQKLSSECSKCGSTVEREECPILAECDALCRELSENQAHVDSLINVRLAAQRFLAIHALYDRVVDRHREQRSKIGLATIQFIGFLSDRRRYLEQSFEERKQQLLEVIDSDLRDAFRLVAEVSASTQLDLSVGLDIFTRTRYRVRFQNDEVNVALRELEQASDVGDAEATVAAIRRLLELAFGEDTGPEKILLWAILLLSCQCHESVIKLANQVLADPEAPLKAEFFYVRGLALYMKGEYGQVMTTCQSALSHADQNDDPRFYHLCGLAMAKLAQTQPEQSMHSLHDALRCFEQAIVLSSGDDGDEGLHASATNNLAYALWVRHEDADLERCLSLVQELETASVGLKTSPDCLHTVGCAYWWAATDPDRDSGNRRAYAETAISYLQSALERAKDSHTPPGQLSAYADSLAEARSALETLPP